MTEALYQKNMNYAPHEIANLFPMMSPDEFVDLKEDIKARGLLEPVVLHEGKILDGRNRFKACQEVGVAIQFVDYAGDDPLGDVISWNLKRRHLSSSQRAIYAANALPFFEEIKNKKRTEKEDWIKNARKTFNPGIKQPCFVCNKYESVTHAHHIFPLHLQYDRGVKEPIHDFMWLCPTHHAAIHIFTDALIKTKPIDLKGFAYEELDALDGISLLFINNYYSGR